MLKKIKALRKELHTYPGLSGEVHFTLRTYTENGMLQLKRRIKEIIADLCDKQKMQYETAWFDYLWFIRKLNAK